MAEIGDLNFIIWEVTIVFKHTEQQTELYLIYLTNFTVINSSLS